MKNSFGGEQHYHSGSSTKSLGLQTKSHHSYFITKYLTTYTVRSPKNDGSNNDPERPLGIAEVLAVLLSVSMHGASRTDALMPLLVHKLIYRALIC